VLLSILAVGVDIPRYGVCSLPDHQQLRLQLCSTYEHDKLKKQI
jgi:hypothetical protein